MVTKQIKAMFFYADIRINNIDIKSKYTCFSSILECMYYQWGINVDEPGLRLCSKHHMESTEGKEECYTLTFRVLRSSSQEVTEMV